MASRNPPEGRALLSGKMLQDFVAGPLGLSVLLLLSLVAGGTGLVYGLQTQEIVRAAEADRA